MRGSSWSTEIRALCGIAHLDVLADDLVAHDITVPDAKRLLTIETALLDDVIGSAPVMPNMGALADLSLPEPILEKVRRLIAERVGDSRLPPSRPQ